jgi:regulator of ribosome biosynthesis
LPTETVEEATVAKLPAPTLKLPRENPLPKPKPQTNWQKYAQDKGITKPKKSKLAWDQTLQVSARKIFVKARDEFGMLLLLQVVYHSRAYGDMER